MDRRVAQDDIRRRIEPLPEGWDLFFEPSSASLPGPLSALRLDAVATDGRTGIVYEFAVGRRALQDNSKVEKLRELRRATNSIPGWSFELIILPEPPPALLSLAAIDERIEAVRSVLSPGSQNAENNVLLDGMFLMAFAVLESCIASLAFEYDVDYQPLAAALGTSLTEQGVLSQEQLDEIRRYQEKRNKIIHGAREVHVARNEVLKLLDFSVEIRGLVDQQRAT